MLTKKWMSVWYVCSLVTLLTIFWILGENYLLTNKIIVSTVTVIFGLKFDLQLIKKDFWFFNRFKNDMDKYTKYSDTSMGTVIIDG